jgi:hypothetical protein
MPNIAYDEDEISNHMWATRKQVEDQRVRGKAFEFTCYADQKKRNTRRVFWTRLTS